MKIGFILEHEKDKVTNLSFANAILEECNQCEALNPKVIAKAILLQAESEDTDGT